ncbi:alpha/beta hydrolase [Shewanella sp. 10N.7]|uniref:alpha/beta hydrolase n=1 Tax=Shewanella sp. 10N.7 TaxID=2885093 RepID=UPI001E65CEE5|nr:alpha/beta hydrolase [Shewanella sp. 10N.7]MCC4833180.1 alpha/beta hydrolase [Shewanella sp. 10N.7]
MKMLSNNGFNSFCRRSTLYRFLMCCSLLCSLIISFRLTASASELTLNSPQASQALEIMDTARNRLIPVELYHPSSKFACTPDKPCPVVILSSGYGLLHTDYQFISHFFQQHGTLVIAVRHELPSDPSLSGIQPFMETRSENWQRGANTLDFIHEYFSGDELYAEAHHYANYDFNQITLVGHSNGGDISAWLADYGVVSNKSKLNGAGANKSTNKQVQYIARIITLDHRRVALPRSPDIEVLSIRASDYPADEGVLPGADEDAANISVVTIEKARHNDMNDYGPEWLKNEIVRIIAKQFYSAE